MCFHSRNVPGGRRRVFSYDDAEVHALRFKRFPLFVCFLCLNAFRSIATAEATLAAESVWAHVLISARAEALSKALLCGAAALTVLISTRMSACAMTCIQAAGATETFLQAPAMESIRGIVTPTCIQAIGLEDGPVTWSSVEHAGLCVTKTMAPAATAAMAIDIVTDMATATDALARGSERIDLRTRQAE